MESKFIFKTGDGPGMRHETDLITFIFQWHYTIYCTSNVAAIITFTFSSVISFPKIFGVFIL